MIEMKDLIYLRDKMKNKQSGFNFASYTVITDSYDDKVVALGIHKIDGSKDKAYVNFAMNWYKNSGYDCKIIGVYKNGILVIMPSFEYVVKWDTVVEGVMDFRQYYQQYCNKISNVIDDVYETLPYEEPKDFDMLSDTQKETYREMAIQYKYVEKEFKKVEMFMTEKDAFENLFDVENRCEDIKRASVETLKKNKTTLMQIKHLIDEGSYLSEHEKKILESLSSVTAKTIKVTLKRNTATTDEIQMEKWRLLRIIEKRNNINYYDFVNCTQAIKEISKIGKIEWKSLYPKDIWTISSRGKIIYRREEKH